MFDFEVGRASRVCAKTGEPLKPGDVYYSMLLWEDGRLVRKDIRADAWEEPAEACIGWWQCEVPRPPAKSRGWAPDEVLLRVLAEMDDDHDEQAVLRFVLALLLVRRRVLREVDPPDGAAQAGLWHLVAPATGATFCVRVCRPAPEEVETLERQLRRVLAGEVEASEIEAPEEEVDRGRMEAGVDPDGVA